MTKALLMDVSIVVVVYDAGLLLNFNAKVEARTPNGKG